MCLIHCVGCSAVKIWRITRPRLAILQKLAPLENICVWTYEKDPSCSPLPWVDTFIVFVRCFFFRSTRRIIIFVQFKTSSELDQWDNKSVLWKWRINVSNHNAGRGIFCGSETWVSNTIDFQSIFYVNLKLRSTYY